MRERQDRRRINGGMPRGQNDGVWLRRILRNVKLGAGTDRGTCPILATVSVWQGAKGQEETFSGPVPPGSVDNFSKSGCSTKLDEVAKKNQICLLMHTADASLKRGGEDDPTCVLLK